MRILIQNVLKCSVVINDKEYSSINHGYCLFISFTNGDNKETVEKMVNKLLKARLFQDENGKTNLNLSSINGEIMSISQFTLYASMKGGNRPDFLNCLAHDEANELYEYFNELLKNNGVHFKTGVFREDMKVHIINDGPFTILLDSKEI
jgi:D-tyrosyl-tRNA(Tyr) deacylase